MRHDLARLGAAYWLARNAHRIEGVVTPPKVRALAARDGLVRSPSWVNSQLQKAVAAGVLRPLSRGAYSYVGEMRDPGPLVGVPRLGRMERETVEEVLTGICATNEAINAALDQAECEGSGAELLFGLMRANCEAGWQLRAMLGEK